MILVLPPTPVPASVAIVEGEPGIFPDPVARFLRAVGRLFGRGGDDDSRRRSEAAREAPEPGDVDGSSPSQDEK